MAFGVQNTVAVKTFQTREVGYGVVRRTDFLFLDHPLAILDNPAVAGRAELQLYTFPLGLILIKGLTVNMTATRSSTGLVATFRDIFGLGTVQSDGTATLTTTEQDIVASTAAAAAVAGVTTLSAVQATPSTNDWTTTTLSAAPKKLWFNHVINVADESVATTPANLVLNGSISLNWELLGDR